MVLLGSVTSHVSWYGIWIAWLEAPVHYMCGTWAYCPNRLVVSHAFFTTVWLEPRSSNYGAFSLPWPVAMQMFWEKRKFLHKNKGSPPTGLVWDTNMVAVSIFRDTKMVDRKLRLMKTLYIGWPDRSPVYYNGHLLLINIFLEGNRMNFSLDIIERTERTNWTLPHRDTLSYELLKVEKSSNLETSLFSFWNTVFQIYYWKKL